MRAMGENPVKPLARLIALDRIIKIENIKHHRALLLLRLMGHAGL
jgi:hypothetical protein